MTDASDAPSRDDVDVGRSRWRDDVRLLGQRGLGLLTASRFVSVLGTGMAPVALAFAVLGMPNGDAGTLGLVLFASALPQVLFMLVGGVAADRFRRSRVMVVAEVLAGVAQAATAVLFLTGTATVPVVAGLAAFGGVAVALFYPALTGIVPEVVADPDLQSANALLRLASNLARILGAALGGLLVATIGAGWALLVDGLSFLVSAVLILLVRTSARAVGPAAGGLLSDLRHGWREFVSRRWIVVIVALFAMANIGFSATVGVLGPVQAEAALGGAGPWAAIVTSFSLGTVVGVVVALRVRPSRPMVLGSLVAPLLAVPVAAAAPPLALPVIVVTAFTAGVAVDVFGVLWETALQQHVPPGSLSRVSAYDWLGSTAFTPLGLAASGAVVAAVGIEPALWLAAALSATPVLALLDPQVRQVRAGRPPEAARLAGGG